MAGEFLPMWAPDARAFKRATYMASTDDVELLGTVKDGDSEGGEVVEHPAARSTTPFGKHPSAVEEPSLDTLQQDQPSQASTSEGDRDAAMGEAIPSAAEEPPPSVPSEVANALDALEAEVEESLSQEALDELEEKAFQRGRAAAMAEMAGKLQSLREEGERHAEVAARFGPVVEELDGLRQRLIRQSSEDVAELALHMARRVVGETLAVHPQALRKLVMDAIERLPGDDEITVRVRPQDLEAIDQHLPTRRSIRVIPDEGIEGGCVVEAQCGEVSSSIDTAFTGLRAAVDEWLEDQK